MYSAGNELWPSQMPYCHSCGGPNDVIDGYFSQNCGIHIPKVYNVPPFHATCTNTLGRYSFLVRQNDGNAKCTLYCTV